MITARMRALVALIKTGGDPDLYRQAVELEIEIIDLVRTNRQLELDNEELRTGLAFKEALTFREPFWYAAGDTVPYCPNCWESQRKAIHVQGPINVVAGTRYDCPQCEKSFIKDRTGRSMID